MHRCRGCFSSIEDGCIKCPYCDYSYKSYENTKDLPIGFVLAGRYCIGKRIDSTPQTLTYYALDYRTDRLVYVIEFFPKDYAYRKSLAVTSDSEDRFESGREAFFKAAANLRAQNDSDSIIDCFYCNGTVYTISKTRITNREEVYKDSEESKLSIDSKDYAVNKEFGNRAVATILFCGLALIAFLTVNLGSFDSSDGLNGEGYLEDENRVTHVDVPVLHMDGHTYACYFGCESWEQARDYCESVGGHLAVISSKEENDALTAFASWCGYYDAFIGYSDIGREGDWEWVDGETSVYDNWGHSEPNGYTAAENYALLRSDGYWYDSEYAPVAENGIISYICEWNYDLSGDGSVTAEDLL